MNDEIIYIGIATDIMRRIHQHGKGMGLDAKFVPYLDNCEIYVHECSKESEMRALETILIDFYKPVLNKVGKTELPSSLSISDDLVSWKLYNEEDYIEDDYTEQNEKMPKRIYSRDYIDFVKRARTELLRAVEIIHAFPSMLEPVFIEREYPGLGTIKASAWSAYEHLPEYVLNGRTEMDINLAFSKINLFPVRFRNLGCDGAYVLCHGVFTDTDGKAYIQVDTTSIKELLDDADVLLARYNRILKHDDCPDNKYEIKTTDTISWENIKHYYKTAG